MSEKKPMTPAEMGRKGGKAKVKKGFAMLTKKQLREVIAKRDAKKT